VRLAIEKQRTIYEVAKALGDEYGAAVALMEIKKLEIKLAELTAKAKAAEAEAIRLTVEAKRAELLASGQMTPAKEAELMAQEAGAKVKKVEAEIAGETAKRMKELADASLMSGNAAATAAAGYNTQAAAMRSVNAAAKSTTRAVSNSDAPDDQAYEARKKKGDEDFDAAQKKLAAAGGAADEPAPRLASKRDAMGFGGPKFGQGAEGGQPVQAPVVKTFRIELGSGKDKVALSADNEDAAQRFLKMLEQSAGRA
jgi:hypothetical protein